MVAIIMITVLRKIYVKLLNLVLWFVVAINIVVFVNLFIFSYLLTDQTFIILQSKYRNYIFRREEEEEEKNNRKNNNNTNNNGKNIKKLLNE